jgi:hypothetical protein
MINFEGINVCDTSRYSPRTETVQLLLAALEQVRLIQVRCPPFSGKTSMAQLVCKRLKEIYNHNINVQDRIVAISLAAGLADDRPFALAFSSATNVEFDIWMKQAHDIPSYLVLDEAQQLYDVDRYKAQKIWAFIKTGLPSQLRLLLFCSYGDSPASNIATTNKRKSMFTPVKISPPNVMYMQPYTTNDINIPGLACNRTEIKDIYNVLRPCKFIYLFF